LAVLPTTYQAQLNLVPLTLDERAIQMVIPIARHHAIGLHHQGFGYWCIAWRRLLRGLHLRDGRPLFAFQFGAGGFGVGAQGLSAHLHPGQGLDQLSGLGEDGETTHQRFPVLETAAGALFGTDTQGRLERQPAVPTPATGQADTRNVDRATATVHRAWLSPTSHRIQRVDTALGACRAPRPCCTGQLPQPGRLQGATNFQNALFASIEVGHWLILSESAQGIDRVRRGCEHLLAEGVRHWASVRAACVVITGGLFLWDGLRYPATHLSRKTQGPFPGSPVATRQLVCSIYDHVQ
jgi:hypothetical protein